MRRCMRKYRYTRFTKAWSGIPWVQQLFGLTLCALSCMFWLVLPEILPLSTAEWARYEIAKILSFLLICGPPTIYTFWWLSFVLIRALESAEKIISKGDRLGIQLWCILPGFFAVSYPILYVMIEGSKKSTGIISVESLIIIAIVVIHSIFVLRQIRRRLSIQLEDLCSCPRCQYDLRHLREPGCPECGWLRCDSQVS